MKKIAPSILSADFTNLTKELQSVEKAKADYIHVDVMDGHFVPNITIGPFIVEAIRRATSLPLDVHLMISEPERYIEAFAKAGSDILTVHIEATTNLSGLIKSIKDHGVRAGVSLNPKTPVSAVKEVIKDVDLVLVMSVNPGFGGQSFIDGSLDKIKTIRTMLDKCSSKAELEVDGGIKVGNIGDVANAGADVFVAGSAIFKSDDYNKTITTMRKEIEN